MRGRQAFISVSILLGFLATGTGCRKSQGRCPEGFPKISVTSSSECRDGRIVLSAGRRLTGALMIDGQVVRPDADTVRGLSSGSHTLSWSDPGGCTADTVIFIGGRAFGQRFLAAAGVLSRHCGGCHGGVNPHAGIDLNKPCQLPVHAERIRARALAGDPSPMPPAGLLPDSLLRVIDAWVASGGGTDR